MNTFFLSLAVISGGGVLAFLLAKRFILMKTVAVLTIMTGCGIGLYSAVSTLLHPGPATSITWQWLHIFTLSLRIDAISAFFLIPVFAICGIAAFYSYHYMDKPERAHRTAVNYFFYSLLVVSMAMVTCADNLVTFALAWELMSLSSFFLVIYEFQNKETRSAGYLYFIFAQGGAMFLFAAFGIIYQYTGSFGFDAIATLPDTAKLIVFILLLIGFGSKAGIFPLHIWLPYAHPAAPSHISAVMSGVMIKMGIYGIVRFYTLLGPSSSSLLFAQIILIAGIISGILGVAYAIGKDDIKKVLAYSSVENIGIILIGLGIGMLGAASGNNTMAAFGFAGAFLHVINHSIFKSLLFMGAGAVLHKAKTKSIDQLGGLLKRMPTTGKTFLVGSISISGLPPFNGFIGELLIYFGAFQGVSLQRSSFLLSLLAIVSLAVIGGLAVTCFTKLVGIAFLGEPRSEKAAQASEAGFSMSATMVILAASCFIIGVFPEYVVRMAFYASAELPGTGNYDASAFTTLIRNISRAVALFLLLSLLVAGLRRLLYVRKNVTISGTWGCGFTRPTVKMQYTGTSYAASVVDFFRPFVGVRSDYSGIKQIFPGRTTYDTRITDAAETILKKLLVSPLLLILDKLRWIQHGNIQLYIMYIVVAIVALLVFI